MVQLLAWLSNKSFSSTNFLLLDFDFQNLSFSLDRAKFALLIRSGLSSCLPK